MTPRTIARNLLKHVNPTSAFIHQRTVQEALGSDGYSYALNNGWIRPDYETGHLMLSMNNKLVEEIRSLALLEDEPEVGSSVTVEENGKTFVAKVQQKNTNGTYDLSFGEGEKPTRTNFAKEQVKMAVNAPPANNAAPAAEQPAASAGRAFAFTPSAAGWN